MLPNEALKIPWEDGSRVLVPVKTASGKGTNMGTPVELRELARNLWWTWQPSVIALFRDLDPSFWREVNHNPVAFLSRFPPDLLKQRASELALEARVNHAFHRLQDYLERGQSWGDVYAGPLKAKPVAYFSAEFGLHESIPIYSGGLGILAGDHLKSASDLGIPLVGVGLLYAQGYFNQRLDAVGWQQERYLETEIRDLPLERVVDTHGKPVRVRVETRAGPISIGIWRTQVGRCGLLLLDSDVPENTHADRQLTGRLYGGDAGVRIRQELILGVGGLRALAALGITPGVLHLNEGHSAFALLEMARQEMTNDGIDFREAMRRVTARTVFTTHTPVAAGHDRFEKDLVESALGPLREDLQLSLDQLMAFGRMRSGDKTEAFCMTVLGIKAARKANGVSSMHGEVTRRMWRKLWPRRTESDVPIGHITNGVHVSSWLAQPMYDLYSSYLGADWERRMCSPETWAPISTVDDDELWEAHEIMKARLVSYVQRQVSAQEALRGGALPIRNGTTTRLDPAILTIGFCRRFATYKRAALILGDEKRLERLVSDPERPVQFIFAGKAHPKDDPGKHLIKRIFEMCHDHRFLGRVAFIEDYDINVGRHLVQGVDLWLNTPRKPLEASGTSGMKAVFNGVLNLSILDGWWAEAYDGSNGFAIGVGAQHASDHKQDARDVEALYSALENEVIPLYYERNSHGIPRGWVARMKNAIRSLAWRFNANRMVMQYASECYLPLAGLVPDSWDERVGARPH